MVLKPESVPAFTYCDKLWLLLLLFEPGFHLNTSTEFHILAKRIGHYLMLRSGAYQKAMKKRGREGGGRGEFLFQPLLPISKISLATCQHPACKLNIGKVSSKKKKEKNKLWNSSASPLSLKDLSFCFQGQMFPHQPTSQPILKPLKEQRTCQSHQWKERLPDLD